jgi:hypothetical protein
MRKEADHWRFSVAGESTQAFLARLLIAMEELRVRLNPRTYPNLEVSDEGYPWFNLPSPVGSWEIFVLPEGLDELPGPALALSFPHRPADLEQDLLPILERIGSTHSGLRLFAAQIPRSEILKAYAQDRQPPLRLPVGMAEILANRDGVHLLNYFGLYFPVAGLDIVTAETVLRDVLSQQERKMNDAAQV